MPPKPVYPTKRTYITTKKPIVVVEGGELKKPETPEEKKAKKEKKRKEILNKINKALMEGGRVQIM